MQIPDPQFHSSHSKPPESEPTGRTDSTPSGHGRSGPIPTHYVELRRLLDPYARDLARSIDDDRHPPANQHFPPGSSTDP